MKNVIVTGGAGFIGSHLIGQLLAGGNYRVTCIDNFDLFYDPTIKRLNISPFINHPDFTLIEEDILNMASIQRQLRQEPYEAIIHLAAKAGVRPSILQPEAYEKVNVGGTQHMLELARKLGIKHFVFASSSSVYGVNPQVPWREDDYVLKPISPYAATKVAAELLGHVYSHLYGINFLALRFFTVYGPGQRPDLAIHKFVKDIHANKAIPVYGKGETRRDYTYVSDIVNGLIAALEYRQSPYEIINLGGSRTVTLMELIATIEEVLGKKAIIEYLPEQPGDVPQTFADIHKAGELLNYRSQVGLKQGISAFCDWFDMLQKTLPVTVKALSQ